MSSPSQPPPPGGASGDRPDALARNFSTQLKSAFNLSGELPSLSSNVANHHQHILQQRQELHRIEAELEEAEEALARRGLAPDLAAAMNAQGAGARAGAAGLAGQGQERSYGGGAGAGTAAAAMGAGAAMGLGESDAKRMARDVYTEGDYEGDAGIRRLGGEGFSMRETDMQHGSQGSYVTEAGYGQQPAASSYGRSAAVGTAAGTGAATGAFAAQQGDRQRTMGAIYDEHRAGGSAHPQSQSSGIDQRQPEGSTTTSERLLHEQNDEPVTPKATGYQQVEFSKPVKGNDTGLQSQGYGGSEAAVSQPAFTSVHSVGYQVNPSSTQVPYNPAGSS